MIKGLTPRQIADRRTRVSASDVGPILGLHPSIGPFQTWAVKEGLHEVKQEPIMTLGLMVEPLAREFGSEALGGLIEDSPGTLLFNDWAAATPDGLLGDDAGIEIKLSIFGDGAWGAEGTDEVPRHYVLQCNWSMHWTGRRTWYLLRVDVDMSLGGLLIWMVEQGKDPLPVLRDALQSGHGARLRVYRVDYRESLALKVVERCRTFWERYIKGDEMPPPTDEAVCGQVLRRMRKEAGEAAEAKRVTPTAEAGEALRAYRDAEREAKAEKAAKAVAANRWQAAELARVKARAELEAVLGDREELNMSGVGRVTFRARKDGVRVLRVRWEG